MIPICSSYVSASLMEDLILIVPPNSKKKGSTLCLNQTVSLHKFYIHLWCVCVCVCVCVFNVHNTKSLNQIISTSIIFSNAYRVRYESKSYIEFFYFIFLPFWPNLMSLNMIMIYYLLYLYSHNYIGSFSILSFF
jgi:hypothetical protein